jgi:hypothetical protein
MAMARRVKRINPGVEWMSAFMRAMLAMDRWTERSDRWKVQSYMQTAIKQRHIRDLVCQDANSRDGFFVRQTLLPEGNENVTQTLVRHNQDIRTDASKFDLLS